MTIASTQAQIDQRRMTELLASVNAHIIDPIKRELILLTISAAVPITIANLLEVGGPQEYHLEAISERLHHTQGTTEDTKWSGFADMMMGGKQSREEIILLCDILAILAFYPGGVTAFGLHFEASVPEESEDLA